MAEHPIETVVSGWLTRREQVGVVVLWLVYVIARAIVAAIPLAMWHYESFEAAVIAGLVITIWVVQGSITGNMDD